MAPCLGEFRGASQLARCEKLLFNTASHTPKKSNLYLFFVNAGLIFTGTEMVSCLSHFRFISTIFVAFN
jgi:hypothetical protein